jgi:hypothetical protein
MSAKGGITEGKSHKEGGIPMVVKSTGQQVELEGGEGVINKRNMASNKTYNFEGKELTICEIASEINKADGNGVQINCDGVVGKKYKYNDGGNIRTLQLHDSVMYNDRVWSLSEKNGVIGIMNLDAGAWGSDYPFIPLSKIDIDNELLDMYGNHIRIMSDDKQYEGGGNIEWSKAQIGDSARVKSENKLGLIIKDYGRKFHLRFADNTEKTYDASELDFYRFDDNEYENGGSLPNQDKLFHLPIEMAVYVPSTQDVDKVISDSEMKNRVTEVSKYLANLFGGFTRTDKVGGYLANNNQVVVENVEPVTAFATKQDFESNKNALISKLSEWARKWGQEAIGFEYEGDLYYVGQEFKNGGNVLAEGTRMEMEHASTINKFKRKDVSTKQVARAIAKDHIKENKNYYNYLKVMEREMKKGISGHEVHKALSDYDKVMHRKRNKKRFALGGGMPSKESVHLIVSEDYKPSLFQMHTGKYVGDSVLRKNELNHLYFIDNDGHNSTFIYPRTDYYFMIPNSIIDLKGYSRKYEVGGNIQSYDGYKDILSTTDIQILDILRNVPTEKLTHQDLEFISTFRGENVVNSLSITLITKLFGLMFKYHTISSPIKNLLISNNGTGNLLNLAPTYLENVFVDFANNDFRPIEEQINFAQNRNKVKFFQNSYKHIDAIVHVYPNVNPIQDELYSKMNENKNGMVVVGVAEFSSVNGMKEFEKSMNVNRKEFNVNLYKVVEGITNRGKHTLIYTINTI